MSVHHIYLFQYKWYECFDFTGIELIQVDKYLPGEKILFFFYFPSPGVTKLTSILPLVNHLIYSVSIGTTLKKIIKKKLLVYVVLKIHFLSRKAYGKG